MDYAVLPVLPPRPVDSFQTYASTINSTSILPPVRAIEAAHRRPLNETQHAIQSLNEAIAKEERVQALKLALRTFSHNNVDLHDYELNLGADKALCLKLGYVVVTSSLTLSEEIGLICQCLLEIYQCSSEQRKRSFRKIGATELVPLLVQILENSIFSIETKTRQEDALTDLVRVLRIYAKLESAKLLLIRFNQGAWLGRVVQYCAISVVRDSNSISHMVHELLSLLKDLTFRSSQSEKETLLLLSNGALCRILSASCATGTDTDPRLVEWFTAVVWNLVLDKVVCGRVMATEQSQNYPIIRTLLRLLDGNANRDETNSALRTKIRRNATSSIGNILSHPETRKPLLRVFDKAENDPKVIVTLLKLVERDPDSIVRRRAMRTLRCLAAADEKETRARLAQENLGTFLVEVISRNISLDDENDRDMQIQACQTVTSAGDQFEDTDWPRIETALMQRIETTTDTKLIQAACSCLSECVRKSPWRRGPSCFSEMFWTRLETVASSASDSHHSIALLLLGLAKVEMEGEGAASHERPSALTNPSVVHTLTTLLSQTSEDHETSRTRALEVVVLLAKNNVNKRPLAENESLLSGLVNLCLLLPGEASKASAKQIIIDLVPEL